MEKSAPSGYEGPKEQVQRPEIVSRRFASLHVTHAFGGGSDYLVTAMASRRVTTVGAPSLVMRVSYLDVEVVEVGDKQGDERVIARFPRSEVGLFLSSVDIASNEIVVHDPEVLPRELVGELRASGVNCHLVLHDMRTICMRGFGVLPNGLPCSGPGQFKCDRCLALGGVDRVGGYAMFHASQVDRVQAFDSVTAPSETAAQALAVDLKRRVSPRTPVELIAKGPCTKWTPGSELPQMGPPPTQPLTQPLTILAVGTAAPHKGARILADLAIYLYVEVPAVRLLLAGEWDCPDIPIPLPLNVTGRFEGRVELSEVARRHNADAFLIPSPAAETHSLTLDDIQTIRDSDQWIIVPDGDLWRRRLEGVDRVLFVNLLGGMTAWRCALASLAESRSRGKL